MNVKEKFEASNGVVWTKHVPTREDNTNSTQYRRSDETGLQSESSFHGAKANKSRDLVVDGNSVPDRETEIAVPTADGESFEYATVEQREASAVSELVASDTPRSDDIFIPSLGENYAVDELKRSYSDAGSTKESPVRYLN